MADPRATKLAAVAGLLLVVGVALLVPGRLLEPEADRAETIPEKMDVIQGEPVRQRSSHWLYAASFLALSAGAALVLVVLLPHPGEMANKLGWGLLALTCLPLVVGSTLAATMAASRAVAGDADAFAEWDGLVSMLFHAFLPMLPTAVVLIALGEARAQRPLTPKWALWAAAAVSVVALAGLLGGLWLGVGALERLGLALAGSFAWLLWAGIVLVRVGRRA